MVGNSVLAFWLVALLLIIVPGADWAFVLGVSVRGLSMPRAVGGIVVGYTAMTAVVAAGVGALVADSPLGLTMLTVVGGVYLMWHGAVSLLRAPEPINAARPVAASERSTLARGIGVSGLNPKGLLLFVALLPQFTSPRWSWPVAMQIAVLGMTFTLTCAAFYFCLGKFARVILRARPATARVLGRISAVAMVVIGALLLIERLAG